MKDGSVEAGLYLLEIFTPHGVERTQAEIAFVCGCSLQNIQHYERAALRKIKAELQRRGIDKIFQESLQK
jgi:hypothetical protein